MKKDRDGVIKIWNQRITPYVPIYKNYDLAPHVKKMISLFIPGSYYFWVLNFNDLSMDYVHPGVQDILKTDPETFTIQEFFSLLPPDQMKMTQMKEDLVTDFLFNFLQPEEVMDYKIVFDLKINDTEGNLKHILHQAIALSQSEHGRVQHVMSIHTDVSHLNFNLRDTVSFVHLNNGPSYYNLSTKNTKFSPERAKNTAPISNMLTKREIEITQEAAKGYTTEKIAASLRLTKNTVDTHRRKIIRKTGCQNMNQVVSQAVLEGVIR